eukprot:TRINITY_DN10000_c0_g1_i3.p2 TRINITY_DN10000_c0_g1~~TRINITY_DN10000_c0_g1_i3.p2  ORF type:complete len:141 (+),score=41.52 TRINITY_DN10000_c0_g1_i3:154-576(+)
MCIRDRYQRRVHGCIKNKIIRITVIIKCLSQETQMADQILSKLQITIDNLRYQQQVLLSEVAEEKVQLNDMVIEYDKMKKEEEYLIGLIKEKNIAVNEYNRMINESQTAYDKLVENSTKLLQALESEQNKFSQQGLLKKY